ncbi:outer membrane protein/peptidoglycan-associated (lipo)protein [Hoeflea sp. IMCC20628]|uniref:OmpA family protein n=1 Tax=Hoeflea sp. IMCC20628 TaxID=1620421 RepID=UPI00063AA92D|nr:OmpA family protein [Hoeflea sp. IMCC20628]AKI00284.1 outer membrane protein/peptidoglycan-associated (lipo)protein [Hoeflea sp. IMCC20628]
MKSKLLIAALAAVFVSGCTTDPYTGQSKVSNLAGGAALGALGGAALGTLAGGDDRKNALIGAGVGALAGGAIGGYMDQQENQLRAQLQGTGVSVTRMGDKIILNMPSNITFDSDQSAVKPQFYETLNSVALVLKKFNRSLVDVAGHTDSTGSDSHNLTLSQQRAQSVSSYLISQGNDPRRFYTQGFGESQPIADNGSDAGRAANRRVEIQISPLS